MITKTILKATKFEMTLTFEQLFHDDGTSFMESGEMNFVVSFKPVTFPLGAFEAKFECEGDASTFFRAMLKKYNFESLSMDPEYYLELTRYWDEEE